MNKKTEKLIVTIITISIVITAFTIAAVVIKLFILGG